MKFSNLLYNYLLEQPAPEEDDDQLNMPELPQGVEEPQGDEEEEPQGDEQPQAVQQVNQPRREKELSPKKRKYIEWKNEQQGLTDDLITSYLDVFSQRKNGFRAFNPTEGANNQPEIANFKRRFRDFPAEDINILKDFTKYTWFQIEFLIDQFTEAENRAEMEFSIQGDTPEIRLQRAYERWENAPGKVVDTGNIIVIRLEGKDESIAYGKLQNMLVAQYGGNQWCTTYESSQNMYPSYRRWSSFYYVLDKSKSENDRWYVGSIQVVDSNGSSSDNGPYCITPRPNGTDYRKSWENIISIYPALKDYQSVFTYFGPTRKERTGVALDAIKFKSGSYNDPRDDDPNYFLNVGKGLQNAYVESLRNINDPNCFKYMSKDILKAYIRQTTPENYKVRYKSYDPKTPFAIIDAIGPENRKWLHSILTKEFRPPIEDGVNAIKASILQTTYNISFGIINHPSYYMFRGKSYNNSNLIGIMDIDTLSWIKDMKYIKAGNKLLTKNKVDDQGEVVMRPDGKPVKEIVIAQRYTSTNDDDYFYLLMPRENFTSKESSKLKGLYLSGPEGDEAISNMKSE